MMGCILSQLFVGYIIIAFFNDFNGEVLELVFSSLCDFVVFFSIGKELVSDVGIDIFICYFEFRKLNLSDIIMMSV